MTSQSLAFVKIEPLYNINEKHKTKNILALSDLPLVEYTLLIL